LQPQQLSQGEKMDFTKTGLTVSKGILAMDTKRVIGVLKDLIISCTISSTGDDDVLSREGIPIPANQDLLREQHVRWSSSRRRRGWLSSDDAR
jgi:hypothetical protein